MPSSRTTCFHGGQSFLHPLTQPPCEGPPPIYEHNWLATLSCVFEHLIGRCTPSTQHGYTKCFAQINTLWAHAGICSMERREQHDSSKLFAICRAARFHTGVILSNHAASLVYKCSLCSNSKHKSSCVEMTEGLCVSMTSCSDFGRCWEASGA